MPNTLLLFIKIIIVIEIIALSRYRFYHYRTALDKSHIVTSFGQTHPIHLIRELMLKSSRTFRQIDLTVIISSECNKFHCTLS